MACLADVNFLVALGHGAHQHAARAAAWLGRQTGSPAVALCRVSQMGFLRILTNRSWLQSEVRTAAEAWSAWATILADDRFVFLDEPPGLERGWRELTSGLPSGRSVETDGYLAAFALAADLPVLTFDRAFGSGFDRRFGLRVEIPG